MEPKKTEVEMSLQFVIFELDDLKYAVDIDRVNEITESKMITPLPTSVISIEGVVNLRGKVIPIINLGRIFGTSQVNTLSASKPFQIMVINSNQSEFGWIIDHAKDVKTIEEKDITPISGLISNSKGYITSTISLNSEIIQVVSIENILTASSLEHHTDEILLIESKVH